MSETTYKEIWDVLSKIDVSKKVKQKNGCSYLSWAWAWGTLMANYPNATYSFKVYADGKDYFVHEDGTVTVECEVEIEGMARTMWLPVMTGYQNKSKVKPDSRDIGDTKMRCLVKCLAMFGLGHYIYAGEDLPRDDAPKPPKPKPTVAERIEKAIAALTNAADTETIEKFWTAVERDLIPVADALQVARLKLSAARDVKMVKPIVVEAIAKGVADEAIDKIGQERFEELKGGE